MLLFICSSISPSSNLLLPPSLLFSPLGIFVTGFEKRDQLMHFEKCMLQRHEFQCSNVPVRVDISSKLVCTCTIPSISSFKLEKTENWSHFLNQVIFPSVNIRVYIPGGLRWWTLQQARSISGILPTSSTLLTDSLIWVASAIDRTRGNTPGQPVPEREWIA